MVIYPQFRASLDKESGKITYGDMLQLKTLDTHVLSGDVSTSEIQSLAGLEYAVNLETLDLSNCMNPFKASELSRLSNLKKLKIFAIDEVGMRDLNFLKGSLNLEEVNVRDTGNYAKVSGPLNITVLKNMKNLKKLTLKLKTGCWDTHMPVITAGNLQYIK